MTKWELLFAILECIFDIFRGTFWNLKTILEKCREYRESKSEVKQ